MLIGMPPDDPVDWVAQLDQFRRGAVDIASIVRAYYDALIVQGFDPEQALALTGGFQGALFLMSRAG